MSLTAASTASAAPPEFVSSFGPDGTASTGFGHAGPIAIDQGSHLVYVIDLAAGSLLRFDLEGNPVPFTGSAPYLSGNQITELEFPAGGNKNQVAVNSTSHRIYVTSENAVRVFESDGEPGEFSAGPGAGTDEIKGFTELRGLAVDVNGAIYTADNFFSSETITVYASSGTVLTHANSGSEVPGNLAIDANGFVYLQTSKVLKLQPSSFPVTAGTEYSIPQQFGPKPSLTVAVDTATNDVYIAETGEEPRIARFSETGALLSTFAGSGEEGEIEQSEGIGIDGTSTRVFVANFPSSGLSQVEIFQPLVAAPSIERAFASEVTADSARLGAGINPNTKATQYYFEFGPDNCSVEACAKVPSIEVLIGNGHNVVSVSQDLTGLLPKTTYHYRVIATNEFGETVGTDQTFTTQGFGLDVNLSDSRVWEMVSPSRKFGGILLNTSSGPVQAAEGGSGLVYQTLGSIEVNAEGNRAIERSTVLAKRGGGGWESHDLTPPHLKPNPPGGGGNEYDAFNRDLSIAALEPRDDNPLSPSASSKTPYLRINGEPHHFVPLVSSKEGDGNVPPGTEFGGPGKEVTISGASPDLAHVVLRSDASLAPGAETSSLYAWTDGLLQTVSALPAGEGGAVVTGILGSAKGSTRNAISEDGSHVFWSRGSYDAGGINTTALYRRDLDSEETVRVDVVQSGATGAGEARPVFQGASADGSVVFFSDAQQLTEDASPEGQDLYRCEFSGPEPEQCDLTNVTAPRTTPGGSAEFLGLVSAFSDDATRAYFVANGVLTAETNEEGDSAVSGNPNLYLWEEGEGARYVATLSKEDRPDWGINGTSKAFSFWLSAASSPNGRYFSFMSERSLTGYDNRDAASGLPAQEIFIYDASTEALECVSCNPTSAAPRGLRIHVDAGFAMVDPQRLWQDRLVAGILPQARRFGSFEYSTYRPRAVLNNGRIFFNAADSLVAADSNGTWDVYQYEPTGLGSCGPASASATLVRTGDACLALISSGTADKEAAFLDASASGDDAFFLTPARLSVLDTDTVYDAYDARVDGTLAVLDPVTECAGEACQPSVAPPNDPTPASEAFRGPGNQVHCPKGKRKVKKQGRVRCVPRKQHRKNQQRKRAGQTGRANR